MSSVKDMQVNFPKLLNQWTISHLLKHTKLSRHLNYYKHNFSVIQEILMSRSGNDNHLFKIKLITPGLMHVEKDLEMDDELSLKQIDCTASFELDVKSTSSFLDYVVRVEKDKIIIPIKQSLSCFSVVSDLNKIAIREDQNYNLQSSMFYN